MNNKNNKNQESTHQVTLKEDQNNYNLTGVYVRDDHCDWGSSGMKDLVETLNDSN